MTDDHDLHAELVKITQALESLIGLSGPAGEQMRQPLLARKAELEAQLSGSGAIAQNGSTAIGQQAIGVNGNVSNSVLNTGTLYQLYLTPQTKKPRLMKRPSSASCTTISIGYAKPTAKPVCMGWKASPQVGHKKNAN